MVLKISLLLLVAIFTSCGPNKIPEEFKEAAGTYAYKEGDTIKMYVVKNNTISDTVNLKVTKFEFYIQPVYVRSVEVGEICLTNTNYTINLYIPSSDFFFRYRWKKYFFIYF